MQRLSAVLATFALAVPALALAAAPPASTAQAQPAPSASATAAAGETNATHIEACANAANALIDNLEKGDTKAATADFDATMKSELGPAKLAAAWKQVGAAYGRLQGRGASQNVMYQGHTIITSPLRFTKGVVNAQVACDADGKIAGFFMHPAGPSTTP